ncbi:hypothetical protein D3C80_1072980 [compost metagenome]
MFTESKCSFGLFIDGDVDRHAVPSGYAPLLISRWPHRNSVPTVLSGRDPSETVLVVPMVAGYQTVSERDGYALILVRMKHLFPAEIATRQKIFARETFIHLFKGLANSRLRIRGRVRKTSSSIHGPSRTE